MPKVLKSKITDYYSEVGGDTSCARVVDMLPLTLVYFDLSSFFLVFHMSESFHQAVLLHTPSG